MPALTILTVFSLSSISNTWMSPCVSCSRRLRYCGFWVRLLGGGGTTSQAFLPDLSEVIPVNLTSTFWAGGLVGCWTGGRFVLKPKAFRTTNTRYESSPGGLTSPQAAVVRRSPPNPNTNGFLDQFMPLTYSMLRLNTNSK